MDIGDIVTGNMEIVDYNLSHKKVKVLIKGFAEDKYTEKSIYIWLDYKDIKME